MYRQNQRKIAMSASSDLGFIKHLKTPSALKNNPRTQILSVDSWVDQNEGYGIGSVSGSKNALKSIDRVERPALGTVSNKLRDRSASLATFKEPMPVKNLTGYSDENLFATPAPKNIKSHRSISNNFDCTPYSKYPELSEIAKGFKQCSIEPKNARAGSLRITDDEYEDVFTENSPVPPELSRDGVGYDGKPEVSRRVIPYQEENDIGDDFMQQFTRETEDEPHGRSDTPEFMYHADSPDGYEAPVFFPEEIQMLQTMNRSTPEPPEPVREELFTTTNWWSELKPEPISNLYETSDYSESDSSMTDESVDPDREGRTTSNRK